MTPAAARDWIAGLEILGMRFGLERIRALLGALDDPQRAAPALHVVGSNGKTSTARLAAAALSAGGRTVGAYLSPHVTDWTERIRIGDADVGERAFAAAATAVREAAEGLDLEEGDAVTQFEALTAMAFHAFREAGVDAMVVEAGLGGRYDATNVLQPDAAVILTTVSLEHTRFLGETEAAIAAEKLSVCPHGHERLVVGRLTEAAAAAVAAECTARGLAPLRLGKGLVVADDAGGVTVTTPRARYADLPLPLLGAFQRDNLAAALAGAEMVAGGPLPDAPLREAIGAVEAPGRLELVPGEPPLLLDGAHNPAGMEALAQALPALIGARGPVTAVVSVLDDKNALAMVEHLSGIVDLLFATRSSHPRAIGALELATLAGDAGLAAWAEEDAAAAVESARAAASPGGLVLVAGSLYLLADLRAGLLAAAAEPPATLAPARKGIDPPEANKSPMRRTSA